MGDLSGPKWTCFTVEGSPLFSEAVLSPETPLRHPLSPPYPSSAPHLDLPPTPSSLRSRRVECELRLSWSKGLHGFLFHKAKPALSCAEAEMLPETSLSVGGWGFLGSFLGDSEYAVKLLVAWPLGVGISCSSGPSPASPPPLPYPRTPQGPGHFSALRRERQT